MSKLIKATKRISAIAASALLLSSASYANVSNYASNFEKNGMFVGEVVVGSGVGADDSAAANVVINDLKSRYSGEEMVELSFSRAGEESEEDDSVLIDDEVKLGDNLADIKSTLDSDDFDLLEDREVQDKAGKNYDYTQEISIGNASVGFGWDSSFEEENDYSSSEPVSFLNYDTNDASTYTISVDFEDPVKLYESSDGDNDYVGGQSFKVLNREFTFDPQATEDSDEIVLYSSSQTVTLDSEGEQSISIVHEGKTYEVRLNGANSANSEVQIVVNGERDTVEKGDQATIAGLNVYVDDVFVNDLVEATKEANAKLFLGSNKVEIDSETYKKIVVNDEEIDGYYAKYTADGGTSVDLEQELSELSFRVILDEMEDKNEFILEGQEFRDPVFGDLSLYFEGPNQKYEDGELVEFVATSSKGKFEFENTQGDSVSVDLFEDNAAKTDLILDEDLNIAGTLKPYEAEDGDKQDSETAIADLDEGDIVTNSYEDGDIFFLNEDTSKAGDEVVTFLAEIEGFNYDEAQSSKNYVTISLNGDSKDYNIGDEISDTGVSVSSFVTGEKTYDNVAVTDIKAVVLSGVTPSEVYTRNGFKVTFNATDLDSLKTVAVEETAADDRDSDPKALGTVAYNYSNDDDELNVAYTSTNMVSVDSDKDNTYQASVVGTFSEEDEDKGFVKFYVPKEEVNFNVYFRIGEGLSSMEGSRVVPASKADEEYAKLEDEGYTVTRNSVEASNVEFSVSAPVMDSAASGSNMIVVGGPAVNSQARALLGMSDYSMANAGVSEGEAVVRYFSDKNSVLAYGWSSAGTMAAVRSLVDGSAVDNRRFSE